MKYKCTSFYTNLINTMCVLLNHNRVNQKYNELTFINKSKEEEKEGEGEDSH